jgi:hypothetical protein
MRHKQPRFREIRWLIQRDFYNDDWQDYCVDSYPILYSSEAEARQRADGLEQGADRSWFPVGQGEGLLSVVSIEI